MSQLDVNVISVNVATAAGTSVQMYVPESGCNLSISGMTSGSVFVELFINNAWVSYTQTTFTADILTYLRLLPGAICRLRWDSVVGTPVLKLVPAAQSNASAEVIGDISNIESSNSNIFIYDAGNGSKTFTAGDAPFKGIVVTGGTANTTVDFIIPAGLGALLSGIIFFINSGNSICRIYYEGASSDAVIIPSGSRLALHNIDNISRFVPDAPTTPVVLAQSGLAVTVAAGGSNTEMIAGGIRIPAKTLLANGQFYFIANFTSSGTVGTRTLTLTLNDGSGASTMFQCTLISFRSDFSVRSANRNSEASQKTRLETSTNVTGVVTFADLVKNTALDCTVNLLVTNPSDSVTLEYYSLVALPCA